MVQNVLGWTSGGERICGAQQKANIHYDLGAQHDPKLVSEFQTFREKVSLNKGFRGKSTYKKMKNRFMS